jgi:AhpC/TSA antioxidant enzyme
VHCREHAVQLHRARSDFEAAGVGLVLIGQKRPRHAADFRRRHGVELRVLADERRATYKAAGARMGSLGDLLGPRSVTAGVAKLFRSRGKIRQGRVIGSAAQLGGALVIASGGKIVWSHQSEDAADSASPEELLEAARKAGITA